MCFVFIFVFSLQSVVEEDEASQELKEKKMRERLVFDFDFFFNLIRKTLMEEIFLSLYRPQCAFFTLLIKLVSF